MMAEDSEAKPRGLTGWIFGGYADYVRGLTPFLTLCVFLFLFSLAMGYALGGSLPGSGLDEIQSAFPDISQWGIPGLFAFIVVNNVGKGLLFMLLGVFVGIPSLFFIIFNGFIIGWVAYDLAAQYSAAIAVASLAPHGVIEVPLFLISMAMGMGIGYQILNRIRGQGDPVKELRLALGFFVRRIVVLFIVSGVVEITITPIIMVLAGYY
jgi:stage II sporulation protein M